MISCGDRAGPAVWIGQDQLWGYCRISCVDRPLGKISCGDRARSVVGYERISSRDREGSVVETGQGQLLEHSRISS